MINLHLDPTQLQIVELWRSGKSALQIGAVLGLTRNAVIGRIDRMRMRGVVVERFFDSEVVQKKAIGPRPRAAPTNIRSGANWWTKTKPPTGVLLGHLRSTSCRYILPETHEGQHVYCGEQKTRGSYCTDHAVLCYAPVADVKKRMRDAAKDVRRAISSN